jgi:hypothetical protein
MTEALPGWMLAGSHHHEYDHGVVTNETHEGGWVGYLRCAVAEPAGFGTVMQIVDAERYRGARVRLRGILRTGAAGWAGLWVRVDEPGGGFSAFDNMHRRRIEGTTGWAPYEVVLDVGAASSAVAFGVLLCGPGEVRFTGFDLDEVGTDVPPTGAGPPLGIGTAIAAFLRRLRPRRHEAQQTKAMGQAFAGGRGIGVGGDRAGLDSASTVSS